MKQLYNINEIQPFIDASEYNIFLGRNGELTAGFRLKLPPIFTKDYTYFAELYNALTSLITYLPDYTCLHKQDFFTLHPVELETTDYLSEQRAKMFSGTLFPHQESFIYLTNLPPQVYNASIITHSPFSLNQNKAGFEKVNSFKEAVRIFQSHLESVLKKEKDEENFYLKELTVNDFLDIPIPGKCFGVLAKSTYLCTDSYSDILFNKSNSDLQIGDKWIDIVTLPSLNNLPLSINPVKYYKPYSTEDTRLHLSMIGRCGAFLNFPHILNTFIFKGNTEKEKKKLETKGTVLSNFAATNRENRLASEEINQFLEDVSTNGNEIVDCHFNVITWAHTHEDLSVQKNEIVNTLKTLNFIPKLETINKATLYFASIPGNEANIFKEFRFKTTGQIATTFLNLDDLLDNVHPKAPFQVTDRFTGAPVNLDITDYFLKKGYIENINKFVLGSSGSGKSVTMNYYTLCNLRQNTHTVIIDMGASYEGICSVFSGLWFEFSSEKPLSFNPFALYSFDYIDGKLSLMKTTTLVTIIKLLWKGAGGEFSESETTTIEKMLDTYYQSMPESYCFNSFYEFVTSPEKFEINPTIKFDFNDFKYILEQYYKGHKHEYLLNATEKLNILENPLVIFETNSIKDSKLFPLYACVIIDTILTKLNNLPKIKKEVLLDEAWRVLTNPILSNFFRELTKTIRKLGGELIYVSQEPEDLLDNEIIKNAIINNCPTKILLSQNAFQKRFDQIQALLGISDHEKNLVFSLNKNKKDSSRDILISTSNGPSAVYTIKLSPAEYLVCTSKQDEKEGIKTVARHFNISYFEAIKYIVSNLFDKITSVIKQAEAKGKKMPYNVAVAQVLEHL